MVLPAHIVCWGSTWWETENEWIMVLTPAVMVDNLGETKAENETRKDPEPCYLTKN